MTITKSSWRSALFSSLTLWAALLTAGPAVATGDDPVIKEMNDMSQLAMQMGMDALVTASTMYPFGVVRTRNGRTSLISYQGKAEDAPSAEDWAQVVFLRVREMGDKNPNITSGVVAKLHHVRSQDGDMVPGIWTQVDHRHGRSMIVFLPLIPNEEGKHTMGELIYHATEQNIFVD